MKIHAERELTYLLSFMDTFIEETINSVLADSEENPEYSAVTANNLIKCYMKVQEDLNGNSECGTVEDYLLTRCFTNDEIMLFEQKRKTESEYYCGVQY